MKNVPPNSYALIQELDTQFPAKCIGPDESPEEAHRYAGKRELIDYLLIKLKLTEGNHLKDSLLNVQSSKS